MLDRRFIRDNPEAVKAAVRVKGIDLDVDELLSLDQSSRELQRELDEAQTRRKAFAKEFARADEATRATLRAEHDEQDLHLKEVRESLGRGQREAAGAAAAHPDDPVDRLAGRARRLRQRHDQDLGRAAGLRLRRSRTTSSCWRTGAGRSSPGRGRWRASGPTRSPATWCCSSGRCSPTRSTTSSRPGPP